MIAAMHTKIVFDSNCDAERGRQVQSEDDATLRQKEEHRFLESALLFFARCIHINRQIELVMQRNKQTKCEHAAVIIGACHQ